MITFDKVIAKGFGSFHDVEFPIKDQGLVLILGDNKDLEDTNGAGKSLLIESVFFSIFDDTLRDIGAADITNLVTKKMLVELTVNVNDKTYTIRNGRKFEKKNKTYEVLPLEAGKGLPDAWWAETAGYGKSVFANLAIVSGGSEHPLVHGTDKQKKDYLTELFGLHIYDECLDVVKSRISEFEEMRLRWVTLISNKENEIQEERKLILPTNTIASKKQELNTTQTLLGELQDSFHTNLELLGKVKANSVQQLKQAKLIETVKNLEMDVRVLEGELGDRINKLEAGEKKLDQLSQELQDAITRYKLVREQRAKFQELGDVCPTCFQPIDPEKKKALISEMLEQEKLWQEKQMSCSKLVAKGKVLIGKVRDYSKKAETLQTLKEQLVNAGDITAKDTVDNLEELSSETDQLKVEIEEVKKEITRISNELAKSESAEQRITTWQAQVNGWNGELKDAVETLKYWDILAKAFGQYGIKSMKLDNILESLNYHIEKYMSFLTSSKISAAFRAVETKARDQFELFVIDSVGERPFKAWSNGEKKRVLIAVLLGIWETVHDLCANPPNFVFLDDCLGDLGGAGQTKVSELLRQISLDGRTVFVTSPASQPSVRFDQVWTVEKVNGVSTLHR